MEAAACRPTAVILGHDDKLRFQNHLLVKTFLLQLGVNRRLLKTKQHKGRGVKRWESLSFRGSNRGVMEDDK